jgi:hypothetical protein
MTLDETTIVDQLSDLADKFDAEADDLTAERDSLSERIALKRRLAGDLRREAGGAANTLFPTRAEIVVRSASNGNGRPGTGEAIVAVLEAKATPVSGTEVFDELERRGWLPLDAKSPRNAVRASLWTLGKNGKIESLGDTPASRRWAAKTSNPTASQASGEEDVG